ncbi:OmpA family protein [Fulvivirga imtechensis AK7]|uniref:OmpA family protein n=1 Tax=Fulvivirga imtechensis AK7 TaxID=1237149 RepID=L8JYD9_9BACT|nr:OmpA family protein [Fulvivirga imtechensis]ELR73780.1 OmpA family protein [Fulvivirga imtechensis AK7]
MRKIIILLLISIAIRPAFSQELKISEIQRLGSGVNTEGHESQPMLTPKGDTLYFIRTGYEENTGGRYSGHDIWFSVLRNGSWSVAQNTLENLNSADNNAVVGISATGDQIYLINSYSPPMRRNRGVVYAKKDKGVWSIPKEIDLSLELKGDFYGFYMHPSEEILLISMNSKGSKGEEDLYVSLKKDEQWTKPIHLGDVINTSGYEISPFLSEGKDSLFFASNGHGGLGDADIFVSRRLSDNWQQWSAPVNLGDQVNSESFDAYYFQSGEKAFFSSSRAGNSDIYMITFEEAEKPEEAPEIAEENEEDIAQEEDDGGTKRETETIAKEPNKKVEGRAFGDLLEHTDTVYFGFDEYQLNTESKNTLNGIVATLKESAALNIKVTLTGHADNKGPEPYNKTLSRKRAEQVIEYLVSLGYKFSDVEVVAKGEQAPVSPNDTPEGRAKNRRVEIFLKAVD